MGQKKSTLSQTVFTKPQLRNKLASILGITSLILAGIFGTLDTTDSLSDWDSDGVPDIYDLDDDNDGIPDDLECSGLTSSGQVSIINGGFELPDANAASPSPTKTWGSGNQALLYNESDVDGWETTASDNKIEIWESGFGGISAYNGVQFAEINANKHAALYQDITTTPGAVMTWFFAHRGRGSSTKDDSMRLLIGPPGGTMVEVGRFGTNNSAWGEYSGTYSIPTGQTTTRFQYESISTASGSISVGNFLDEVRFYSSDTNCPVNSDGDTDSNSFDLDSDNDGIYDLVEAGGTDTDNNGLVDNSTDTDGDGLADEVDTDPTDGPLVSGCTLGVDCDLSGSTSSLFDANMDGINELTGDFDEEGVANWADLDSDGDGLLDATEGTADTDGDGNPNFLDIDSDGDGVVDNIEAQSSDAYTAPADSDSDADGLDNSYDDNASFGGNGLSAVDSDTDTTPDYLDLDADDDGESDAIEAHDSDGDGIADSGSPANTGKSSSADVDGDGLDDGFDNDLFSRSPTNGMDSPEELAKNDGGSDLDFRSGSNFPVEWLSFEGIYQAGAVELSWATASEENSAFFEIQRSIDGTIFESLNSVTAAGNSSTVNNYSYTDPSIALTTSKHFIYRLKQVDLNGTFDYSNLVEVFVGEEVEGKLDVFPNPTTGPITMKLTQASSGNGQWQVLDITGKVLMQGSLDLHQAAHQIDLSALPAGIYVVSMENQESRFSKQLIKK